MSHFTEDEFDIAFHQVYPEFKPSDESENCKKFLKFVLTKTYENVFRGISSTLDENKGEMNKCLNTIIGNTSIDELMTYIDNDIISQPSSQTPFFLVKSKMLQNREQAPPASALFASAHPPASAYPPASALFASAYPPASAPFASTPASADFPIPKTQKERIQRWWELRNAGRTKEADHYYGANIYLDLPSGVGGSRRRRSSHRKRKSYRKSKRVRHTRRKQTRRHRHRYSRYRR
jgi:hypothetical protein